VKEAIETKEFWVDLQAAITFLSPFSDFIHQIEADRPALGRCYEGILIIDDHIRACAKKWEADGEHFKAGAETALRTWERRLKGGGRVQRLMDPAYVLAYLLDPLYGAHDGDSVMLPNVPDEHWELAKALVERVGGEQALSQLTELVASGWSSGMPLDIARGCVDSQAKARAASLGSKRKDLNAGKVATLRVRKGLWKKAATSMPELSDVAIRVLCVHPTFCATERNWKMWGRVFTAARTHLGKSRAQKMISFCFNTRAQHLDMSDLALQLDVVERNVEAAEDDDSQHAETECEMIDVE
jgi:hypothetical protein